jgi:DHA1 family bicyclomycin/chloramphenicol resistance-like MFS transporter
VKKWIGLLALLAAFPPLSTDMYLPAIPSLAQQWRQPLWVINLTLVCFFMTYSFFMLVYGPVSDRFGRRPLLKTGISIYILASLMCALAPNAAALIVFRIIQAAGGACASSLALAISRDVFEVREREKVLAYIGVIVALCPMLSPVIGGWLLAFFSWRWIFVLLAVLGAIALLWVYRMPETLLPVDRTTRVGLFANYFRLICNPSYLGLVFLVSFSAVPLFAFIGASSDIYITRFGQSAQVYGYFFGFNAMALMAGALACVRLSRLVSTRSILTAGFAGIAIGGVWLLLNARQSPWDLALPMFLISFSTGMSRPPSNNLVLQQAKQGVGSASSLLMFFIMTFGASAMWLISLDWPDKIQILGLMALIGGGVASACWLVLKKAARSQ